MKILIGTLLILGGFCLGSIMFSKILPKLIMKKDIQINGRDENPGAANVFMHCGWQLGLICLALDMLKGFIPVFLSLLLIEEKSAFMPFIILAPALGHAVAPFNHFRGGKCISTVFGELIALLRITPVGFILAVLYIIFATLIRNMPNRLRSIWAFSMFIVLSTPFLIYFGHITVAIGCVLISVTAIIKHSKLFVNEAQAQFEKSLQSEENTEGSDTELVEIR